MDADLAVAQSQSYSITTATGSRTLSRADSAEIKNNIRYWRAEVNALEAERNGVSGGGFISVGSFKRRG